jgi:acetate kinase
MSLKATQAVSLQATQAVLVLNAGSSSLKFALYPLDEAGEGLGPPARRGQLEGLSSGAAREQDAARALQALLEGSPGLPLSGSALLAVGHRVVHGGTQFSAPCRITPEVLSDLRQLEPLAPLHQPHNLAPVQVLAQRHPELTQVACFDTAFHRTQPMHAEIFALPRHYYDEGIRRYGFHGLSYEYVAQALSTLDARASAGRTIVAHLGNGVSMCALQAGRSVASTMGFTALEGCPMGTRSGSLDPGVILHLARAQGLSMDQIEDLLYRRSGLLGLSGLSNDMRTLEASDAPNARLAIEVFVYRLVREIGSLAAALGGLDALVFTAGIGEHSARVRQAVCDRLGWLGIHLDAPLNAAPPSGAVDLSAPGASVRVWRIPTDEERMIATHTLRVARQG